MSLFSVSCHLLRNFHLISSWNRESPISTWTLSIPTVSLVTFDVSPSLVQYCIAAWWLFLLGGKIEISSPFFSFHPCLWPHLFLTYAVWHDFKFWYITTTSLHALLKILTLLLVYSQPYVPCKHPLIVCLISNAQCTSRHSWDYLES